MNLPRASTTPQEQPFILSQGSGHTPHRPHLPTFIPILSSPPPPPTPRKEPRCRNLLCLHTQSTPVHLHSPPRAFLCTYFPSVPVQFRRGFVFLELQCSSSLPSVRTVLIGFFLPFLLQLLNHSPPPSSLKCLGLWKEFFSIVLGAREAVSREVGWAAARIDWLKTLPCELFGHAAR